MRRNLSWCWLVVILNSCLQTETSTGVQEQDNTVEKVASLSPTNTSQNSVISLLGKELKKPELTKQQTLKREKQLNAAKVNFDKNQDSLENIIWFGRRLAYLYHYDSSISVYSAGLKKFPDSYKLYRHRGHRYITTRQFDKAIFDLEQAAFFSRNIPIEIEQDGLPNKRNIPRTSVQFNIWYHLGLAYYLKGDFDKAISSYKKCLAISDNDDMLVATTDWLYMTYRKIGNLESAQALLTRVKKRMDILENTSYHNRLLMYMDLKKPKDLYDLNSEKSDVALVTQGYGVGNWYYYNGKVNEAIEIFEKIIESDSWHAFGYLAAEVELYNIRSSGS